MLPELMGSSGSSEYVKKSTPIIMMTARDSVMTESLAWIMVRMTTLLSHLPLKSYWPEYVPVTADSPGRRAEEHQANDR